MPAGRGVLVAAVVRMRVMSLLPLLLVLMVVVVPQGALSCDMTEFTCDDNRCVPISNYCDGVAHCKDFSDEPPGCSVCNRTYYGVQDHTYQLEVPPPPTLRAGSPPPRHQSSGRGGSAGLDALSAGFKCVLTFAALGGYNGDIVQVTFINFHVGYFNLSDVTNGCAGDHVSIEETALPTRGGRWCGQGSGFNVYYSETSSVTVTLQAASVSQGEYFDNPLQFKIRYKFLRHGKAVVRYGPPMFPKYRGEYISNTVCSRIFEDCRARPCRLQSPNFPGLYPRNVTCYYLVKLLLPPSSEFSPVVELSQANDRLIHIGHQKGLTKGISPESRLRQDDDCKVPDDYILIYDGGSVKDPLLAKICGTAIIPNITSSGPEMLIVFQTASSGMMNHLANLAAGFELEARLLYLKGTSSGLSRRQCMEDIKSFGGTSGVIYSPVFAMAPNSSCTYNFLGRRGEQVWLYFTKYHRVSKKESSHYFDLCHNRLSIYEGKYNEELLSSNSTLVEEFCEENVPPVCVRYKQYGSITKPCTKAESFLSSGSLYSVVQEFTESTLLLPLEYIIHYEFVNLVQKDVEPDTVCDQVFTSARDIKGHFTSPRNVFLYGRGGRKSLSCKYVFKTQKGEAVKLKLTSVSFRRNMCKTIHNNQTNLYECIARLPSSATIEVWETPWINMRLPLGCICDDGSNPATFTSYMETLQLDFKADVMSWGQDHEDFYFDAEYEFFAKEECSEKRIVNGTTGSIFVGNKDHINHCTSYPWQLQAKEHSHLYLKIPGYRASSQRCTTNNRIVIYGSHSTKPINSICPSSEGSDSVDVFSEGWTSRGIYLHSLTESLMIVYLAREIGVYKLTWLEVTREPTPSALESLLAAGMGPRSPSRSTSLTSTCKHLCPKLDACISSELWCDGTPHCPSGADEMPSTCLYFTVPWLYIVAGVVTSTIVIFIFIAALVAVRVHKRGKVKRHKKKEAQRLMTREVLIPLNFHKETLY
ncbi:unnamed protein product [Meganyctiphanes norvegica]|uniref:CUB domain-containing protein n=1 Tax=Meganyctiphanes norvegica TaxID=48144 RepID=A0AAV2RCW3_MEGNR